MRDVAIVASSMVQAVAMDADTEVEFMVPLVEDVKRQSGLDSQDFGFVCSGSSDFLAGQAFSFVMTLDAVGAVPPISESHVEMDGAWALYEAWVKLQLGEVDTALVYSYGKTSPGSLRDVLATQLDPYYVTPLWPDAHSLAALAARQGLESGRFSSADMAEVVARSLRNAAGNPPRGALNQNPLQAHHRRKRFWLSLKPLRPCGSWTVPSTLTVAWPW